MNNLLKIYVNLLLLSCSHGNNKNNKTKNNPDFHNNNDNKINNNDDKNKIDENIMFLKGPQQGELLKKIQNYGLKQIEGKYMFLFNKNKDEIIGHIQYSDGRTRKPKNIDLEDIKDEKIKSKIKKCVSIWKVKIKEKYRLKGYFKRMFLFFLSHFEQNTLFDLIADSEAKNIDNKTLIKIYEKFGFKIAGNFINLMHDIPMYYFKDSDVVQYKKQVQK